MALYVRDREVDRLVERLAQREKLSKTEIVRRALQREWDRGQAQPSLVEKGLAFVRDLHAQAGKPLGPPADKDFIDSLDE